MKTYRLFIASLALAALSSFNSMPRRNAVKAGQRATTWLLALLLLAAINASLSTCFAQGSLTPPGAPAPTMITLSQIEPRTPISSAPFTITQPGSYYLTTNLNVTSGDAIDINTNGVTLDLNGFTISSTANPASGDGILISDTLMNVTVRNGCILSGVTNTGGIYGGNGFLIGVGNSGVCYNLRVSDVSVSGCLQGGIQLNRHATVVAFCTVNTTGGEGIYAETVSDSTAFNCGSKGIYAQIANNCYGASTGDEGLSAATANNCYGTSSSSSISTTTAGLAANDANNCYGYNVSSGIGDGLTGTTAINCYGVSYGGDGIDVVNANNCSGTSSSGDGVYAFATANNCYGTSSGNGNGVKAGTAQNCYGTSGSNSGVNATSAINCYGLSYGNGDGLDAAAAQNCWGTSYGSGTGVSATTANNCTASSNTGTGLYAGRTAIGCDGESIGGTGLYVYTGVAVGSFGHSSTGLGLKAYVANGCYGQNNSGTSEFTGNTGTDQRYNMP